MRTTLKYKNFPWFTICFSILLIVLYAIMAVLSGSLRIESRLFPVFGAPYAIELYNGRPWGVILNSFYHLDYIHISMNLAGLWIFGAFLERRIGWMKMAIFGLVCAAFTSMVQLAVSDDAGLGIGGVNHGFFALILVLSFRNDNYRMALLYPVTLIVAGLLVFFLIENEFNNWSIGLESKLAGLFWGFSVGLCSRWKALNVKFAVLLIPFSLAVSTLIYAPWSSMWMCTQGIEMHASGQLRKAQWYYQRSLRLNKDNRIASDNLKLVKIDFLSEKAFEAHKKGHFLEAHRYYLRILALDKKNNWALTNLKRLP